jgi:hypothetical protein
MPPILLGPNLSFGYSKEGPESSRPTLQHSRGAITKTSVRLSAAL